MSTEDLSQETPSRTAGEAGWHVSRYNVMAQVPGTKKDGDSQPVQGQLRGVHAD